LKVKYISIQEIHLIQQSEPWIIIAESGGSKTDWRIKTNNQIFGFQTINFHPNTLREEQKEIITKLAKVIPNNSSLYFYGSGCLQIENQTKIKSFFESCSFSTLEVYSDLVAAGISIWGKNTGYFGILGTGSVLAHYKKNEITELTGGYGYLLGDEGSGYFFGKLAIQYYLNANGSNEFNSLFESKYGDKKSIFSKVYNEKGKEFISQIQLKGNTDALNSEINQLHRENITLFIETYLKKNPAIKEIGFIGSYAFYHEEILKKLLHENGIILKKVIQKPIDLLIEQHF
jgi:glucosamine kinase